MYTAHSVSCGGLEGAEAAADPSPGDVPQPLLSEVGVFGKRVETQLPVSRRIVVAARHTARESRHSDLHSESEMTRFRLILISLHRSGHSNYTQIHFSGLQAKLHVPPN